MTAYPATQVFGFSYIDHLAFLIMEIVDPRGIRYGCDLISRQVRRQVLFPAFPVQHLAECGSLTVLQQDFFKQNGCGIGISPGPVPVLYGDFQFAAKLSQAVTGQSGKDLPAETDRTKFFGVQLISCTLEVVLYKGVVEVNIVCYKYFIL